MFIKKTIITAFLIVLSLSTFAQWEFNYFVLKLGANHNMFSPQPQNYENLYMDTPEGIYRLAPDSIYLPDYVPGITAGVDFHFDMPNDKLGFVVGINYQNKGISAKYHTLLKDYTLIQTYRINTVSIPAFIKVGNDIFNMQSYFFAGVRFDVNFAMSLTESASYKAASESVLFTDNNYFNPSNVGIVFGYNFFLFNFELSYYFQNFFNKSYSQNVGTPNDPYNVYPFKCQPDNIFFFQTSIYVPLSSWTKNRVYFLNRWFR